MDFVDQTLRSAVKLKYDTSFYGFEQLGMTSPRGQVADVLLVGRRSARQERDVISRLLG